MHVSSIMLNKINSGYTFRNNINFNARPKRAKEELDSVEILSKETVKPVSQMREITEEEEYFYKLMEKPAPEPEDIIWCYSDHRCLPHGTIMIPDSSGNRIFGRYGTRGFDIKTKTSYHRNGNIFEHEQISNSSAYNNKTSFQKFTFYSNGDIKSCEEKVPALDFRRKIIYKDNVPIEVEATNPVTGEVECKNLIIARAKELKQYLLKEYFNNKNGSPKLPKIDKTDSSEHFEIDNRYEECETIAPLLENLVKEFREHHSVASRRVQRSTYGMGEEYYGEFLTSHWESYYLYDAQKDYEKWGNRMYSRMFNKFPLKNVSSIDGGVYLKGSPSCGYRYDMELKDGNLKVLNLRYSDKRVDNNYKEMTEYGYGTKPKSSSVLKLVR